MTTDVGGPRRLRHTTFTEIAREESESQARSGYDSAVGPALPSPPPSSEVVRSLLRTRPGTAFVEGATGRVLTWEEVVRRSDGWTAARPDLGVRPDGVEEIEATDRSARVGLLVEDPLEMGAAFLSAMASGIAVAPLDPGATTAELARAARILGLSAVVGGPRVLEGHATALRTTGVDLWGITPDGVTCVARRSEVLPTGPGGGAAVVLSSSGTTGTPKLMPLRPDALLHTARSVVAHHRLEPSDCGYSPLPLFHINGLVVGVLAALVGGHRLVLDRRFSASTFWGTVERTGATWLNLVPAVISVLAARPVPARERLAQVAFARSASAPLPVATLQRFEAATGVPILETYGMTEAGSQISANPRPPAARRPGSVGRPVGLELRVVDDARGVVPTDVVGHVEIRGASVVTEYWAPLGTTPSTRPAQAADGWLVTGDLGHVDADGFVHLVGRDDDVINRGGEKVYPREIEEVLLAEPDVAAAAVVGRPHEMVGEEPVAFVVAAVGVDPESLPDLLWRRCETELSRFRRPADIVVVDRLPSGLNGKIRRRDLREMVAGQVQ